MSIIVIVTIGPSISSNRELITRINSLVPCIFRINGAHGTLQEIEDYIDYIRETVPNSKIMIDLPGNKIQLSNIEASHFFEIGVPLTLKSSDLNYPPFISELRIGDKILANDSMYEFKIIEIIDNIDKSLETNISDDWLLTANYNQESAKAIKNSALQQSLEIIRRRIDETGTNEPIIQRQGIERIMVQLPGIDDPERVKRLLGKTAKMNFRMVDEKASIQNAINGRIPAGSELLYGNEEDNKILLNLM